MIKEVNFSKMFSDLSQTLLKFGRNIRWVDILFNKKMMMSSLICDNHQFDVMTTREVESPYFFFIFGWIKLEFGVRGDFRLLISNLNSKRQYQFEILRKCHFSSLRS